MKKLGLIALLTTVSLSAFAAEPCKYYLSVDLGWPTVLNGQYDYDSYATNFGQSDSSKLTKATLERQSRGLAPSISLGYGFNEYLRGEIGLDMAPKLKSTAFTYNLETREVGGRIGLAYDFNNSSPVTPFVFGSIGFVTAKAKIKPSNRADSTVLQAFFPSAKTQFYIQKAPSGTATGADAGDQNSESKTLGTFKLGVGFSIKASDMVAVELKYGLGARTNEWTPVKDLAISDVAATAQTNKDFVTKTLTLRRTMDHTASVGLRITF